MAKPHEILGVAPSASFDEVRAQFKRLAAQHHPDRGGDHDTFVRIKTAFDTLRAKHEALGPFDDIFTDIGRRLRE